MSIKLKLKQWAKQLKTETYAIYLASKHPDVPWYAKVLIIVVAAHTFSPIDLIPDFIPVLGYLDDLIITPLGITLAIKMVPPHIMEECRQEAQKNFDSKKPIHWAATATIIFIWIIIAILILIAILKWLNIYP